MSSSSRSAKRPAARTASISPPPPKRKTQSATTNAAVASFFTPTSQKPKDRTNWAERAPPTEGAHSSDDNDAPATLLVAKYTLAGESEMELPSKRRKIAAFDLDSTLIKTSSGRKHADGPGDWKWWDKSVPAKLKSLYHDEGYRLVIFSNQGGITLHPDPKASKSKTNLQSRLANFKTKCGAILSQLDLPVTLYAATGKDIFRKPRTGMWAEMLDDYDLSTPTDGGGDSDGAIVDLKNSFFVGDAGGRTALQPAAASRGTKGGGGGGGGGRKAGIIPKDFSCSDRNMAHNIGIKYFTPEEFFLDEKEERKWVRDFDLADHPFPELDQGEGLEGTQDVEEKEGQEVVGKKFLFEKVNKKDVVLLCGPPGAGKSTFYWKQLEPLGYERANQDLLKTKEKCLAAAAEFLKDGVSVAVDNTNPDPATRALWIALAKKHGVPIRCVWLRTPLWVAQHNDAARSMNKALNPESRAVLPTLAFNTFKARFEEPERSEGFQDVVQVEFKFRGTREEYGLWAKYWL